MIIIILNPNSIGPGVKNKEKDYKLMDYYCEVTQFLRDGRQRKILSFSQHQNLNVEDWC